MSILFFKKPAYVAPQRGPLSACQISSHPPSEACANAAIPAELSFERIICNKCAPPCSLQDFLDYLMYVAHDAENLQFYLWMVDYYQRFRNAPQVEKDRSPRWKGGMQTALAEREERVLHFDSLDLDKHSEDISSAASEWEGELSDNYMKTIDTLIFSVSQIRETALQSGKRDDSLPSQLVAANQKQPFRTEIDRIVNHYLAPGAPRELNLSHDDRATVLHALQYTTHPSAFNLVKIRLDATLRNQSHPNFVRWSICNGNKQWTIGKYPPSFKAFSCCVFQNFEICSERSSVQSHVGLLSQHGVEVSNDSRVIYLLQTHDRTAYIRYYEHHHWIRYCNRTDPIALLALLADLRRRRMVVRHYEHYCCVSGSLCATAQNA